MCNYLCIFRKFRANDHSKSNKSLSKRMGKNISLQINFICLIWEFYPSGYSITDVILNQNHSALVCFCILTTMWLLFNSFSNKKYVSDSQRYVAKHEELFILQSKSRRLKNSLVICWKTHILRRIPYKIFRMKVHAFDWWDENRVDWFLHWCIRS